MLIPTNQTILTVLLDRSRCEARLTSTQHNDAKVDTVFPRHFAFQVSRL